MISLSSKLSFLLSVPGIAWTISEKDVVITGGKTITGFPVFIDRLKNSHWDNVLDSDISRLTLVGFAIQADDRDMYGSRWCVSWFNRTYPDKFFMRDSKVYHKAQDNSDGTFSMIPCVNQCDHHLHFDSAGEDGDCVVRLK